MAGSKVGADLREDEFYVVILCSTHVEMHAIWYLGITDTCTKAEADSQVVTVPW